MQEVPLNNYSPFGLGLLAHTELAESCVLGAPIGKNGISPTSLGDPPRNE